MNHFSSFSSECVSAGNSDKVCDQISDAILSECLLQDPSSRVEVDAAVSHNTLFLFGKISSSAQISAAAIAKNILARTGYDEPSWGLAIDKLQVIDTISFAPEKMALGVDVQDAYASQGGIFYGYSCNETPAAMPLPIALASQLMVAHHALRRTDIGAGLGPDAKSQVTVSYENGSPSEVTDLILLVQHRQSMSLSFLREIVTEGLVKPILGNLWRPSLRLHINPMGAFNIGGPLVGTGMSGRKTIDDTYGATAFNRSGTMSGRDATHMGRSVAYAARQLAKDVVSRGWAERCEVQVTYGVENSTPKKIDFITKGDVPGSDLVKQYQSAGIDLFEILAPSSIISRLQLRLPSYLRTAAFGHFGRADVSWEKPIDRTQVGRDHIRELAALEQGGRLGFAASLALKQIKASHWQEYSRAREDFMHSHL